MTIKDIKENIINFIKQDVVEKYYMALNDGDIRSEYKIGDFINFINDNEFIDYIYFKDILKIEGLFTKKGIYPIVLNKITTIISTGIEKEKIKEDYILEIDKTMVVDSDYCYELLDKKVIYNEDEYKLFYDAFNKLNDKESLKDLIKEQMKIVRENHTYINRINDLLKILEL